MASWALDYKSHHEEESIVETGTARVKRGMAEMLKGGVIMDVVTPEQARIAEGPGPSRSWHWSGCPPTSAPKAASRE